jgi:hypothetical protein
MTLHITTNVATTSDIVPVQQQQQVPGASTRSPWEPARQLEHCQVDLHIPLR